jgi:pyruvate/2-oxoglutarate dehydrogenase complex dihydrolipoamide dehydrogenase (E3) component
MGIRLINGRLGANDTRGLATNIPGAYAVGDANSDMVTNIPHALSSGKRAAVFIHGKQHPPKSPTILYISVLTLKQCDSSKRSSRWLLLREAR